MRFQETNGSIHMNQRRDVASLFQDDTTPNAVPSALQPALYAKPCFCGFRTAYVNRPLEYGPGVPQEDKQESFDFDADDFVELAKKLRSAKATGYI